MLKKLNQTVQFIHENLEEAIDWDAWFTHIQVDPYSFKQVFFHLTGMTLNDYLRKLRLVAAHQDLFHERVTDVAYKYQYQSLDGFTRAFKSEFSYLPSEVSKHGAIQMMTPLLFNIEVKGGHGVEYKIIELPALKFAGVSTRVPMQFEGVNQEIVNLAHSITEAQRQEIHRIKDMDVQEILNISYDSDTEFKEESGSLTHMIGVMTQSQDICECLDVYDMPASLWATFPYKGEFPKVMQDTMARIYSEWLVNADYDLQNYPTFSYSKVSENGLEASGEIWISVKKQ